VGGAQHSYTLSPHSDVHVTKLVIRDYLV